MIQSELCVRGEGRTSGMAIEVKEWPLITRFEASVSLR